jgi:hypothetical protein
LAAVRTMPGFEKLLEQLKALPAVDFASNTTSRMNATQLAPK